MLRDFIRSVGLDPGHIRTPPNQRSVAGGDEMDGHLGGALNQNVDFVFAGEESQSTSTAVSITTKISLAPERVM